MKRMICGVRTAETPTAVDCVVVRRRRRMIGMVDIRLMMRMDLSPATAAHVRNMMGVMGTIPNVEGGGSVCVLSEKSKINKHFW